jgi:hypothetical protein
MRTLSASSASTILLIVNNGLVGEFWIEYVLPCVKWFYKTKHNLFFVKCELVCLYANGKCRGVTTIFRNGN